MKEHHKKDFETKMDMTPLIDCVFLLIMFFILTTEITVQLEEVVLPVALEGKPQDEKAGGVMLILNVVYDDDPNVPTDRRGRIVFAREPQDLKSLTAALKREAERAKLPKDMGGQGLRPEITENGTELSQLEILVRADHRVRSEYLRTVFMACKEAAIYKIKLATMKPEPLEG